MFEKYKLIAEKLFDTYYVMINKKYDLEVCLNKKSLDKCLKDMEIGTSTFLEFRDKNGEKGISIKRDNLTKISWSQDKDKIHKRFKYEMDMLEMRSKLEEKGYTIVYSGLIEDDR